MDIPITDYLTGIGTAVIAACMVLTLLYKITIHFLKNRPALLKNCCTNIIKLLHNCSLKLQSKSLIKVLRTWLLKLQSKSLIKVLRKYLVTFQSKCSLESLGKYACNLAVGVAASILGAYVATIPMDINTANEKLVQTMITEVTDITKESEKRVQENTEDLFLKFFSYIAPPRFHDKTIKEALNRARYKGYLFVPIPRYNKDLQYYFISPRWLSSHGRPSLLTKKEEAMIMTRFNDGGQNQDVMTLMRSILDDENIMDNLEYNFFVGFEEIHLSFYDKIGIIAGYINMLKAKVKNA